MTDTLFKKTKLVIKACKLIVKNFPDALGIRIQQRIRKTITMINQNCNMAKKQAPVINWDITKKLAKSLWEDISVPRGSNITSIRARKAAATALILTAKSGARWIDVHRIMWQDLKFTSTNGHVIVQAPLRLSKNNLTNNMPQAYQWASSKSSDPEDCPWLSFKRWWIWCGRPKQGFVFSNGRGEQLCHKSTMSFVTRHANQKLGLTKPFIPTMHSGRVTHVLTLDKLNMSKRSIIRSMNWKTDTMINYYMNTRSMCSDGAPALKLASLKNGELQNLQKDLR